MLDLQSRQNEIKLDEIFFKTLLDCSTEVTSRKWQWEFPKTEPCIVPCNHQNPQLWDIAINKHCMLW